MRIWATLDDFLRPQGATLVGRNVANNNFLKALFKYGSFDEYHFFLANSAHRRLFREKWEPFLGSLGMEKKVKLLDRLMLADMMREVDYTVFHCSDHVTWLTPLCRLRNRYAQVPVTGMIFSLSYPRLMNSYLDMMHGGIAECDALLCISKAGRKVVENCFDQIHKGFGLAPPPLRMEISPLGLDAQSLPRLDRAACRAKLGFSDSEPVALCFGRLSDHDKMDLFPLMQAFRDATGDSNCRLVLAGASADEDYERMLRLWAKALGITDKISIFKNPDEDLKWLLFHAADFFVSPTDNPQETFGITLVEAMACGLPMIVSDYDGYKEVAAGEVAVRVKTTWDRFDELADLAPLMDERTLHRYFAQSLAVDVGELTEAIRKMIREPEDRRRMGEAGRLRFLEKYDYRILIPQMENLWDELKKQCDITLDETKSDPMAMDVFEIFSHYPTETISPDALLRQSQLAIEFRKARSEHPLFAEMSNIIDKELIPRLLFQLRKPARLADIVRRSEIPASKTRYALMWMLKHGLIEKDE